MSNNHRTRKLDPIVALVALFHGRRIRSACNIILIGTIGAWLSIGENGRLTAQETTSTVNAPNAEGSRDVSEKRPAAQWNAKKEFAPPLKVIRYAQHLMKVFDANGDGILQEAEWKQMEGHPERIDADGDSEISLDELTKWIVNFGRRKQFGRPFELEEIPEHTVPAKPVLPTADQPAEAAGSTASPQPPTNVVDRKKDQRYYVSPKRLPTGLPEWFSEHDLDGDGQLSFNEFAPAGGAAELAEFESYDANGDGLVTAKEYVNRSNDKSASKSTTESSTSSPNQSSPKPTRKKKRPPSSTN